MNSNAGPAVVSFGSFGGFTHDPWGTMPYLQLPGWTVQSIYAIVGGLFVLYVFGLLGSSIPGVSNLFSGLSGKSIYILRAMTLTNLKKVKPLKICLE